MEEVFDEDLENSNTISSLYYTLSSLKNEALQYVVEGKVSFSLLKNFKGIPYGFFIIKLPLFH